MSEGRFVIGNSAQDKGDRVIYHVTSGALFVDVDGQGGQGKIRIANLDSGLALTHANIFMIA
ncbi:MAG: hypothetical protein VKJ64_16100 [Leptolyngbyaceae bacterium]|nr:hypothetical protein [Leptolyngbyaceae bacterium]